MLLRMVPEAISAAWPSLEIHIKRSLPGEMGSDFVMNKLLEAFLLDRASVWVSYNPKESDEVNFIMVLTHLYDEYSNTKNLNIYAITNIKDIDLKTSNRMWLEGFVALRKYMQANGYSKLTGYFDQENFRSRKMVERFGGTIRYYTEIDMR